MKLTEKNINDLFNTLIKIIEKKENVKIIYELKKAPDKSGTNQNLG